MRCINHNIGALLQSLLYRLVLTASLYLILSVSATSQVIPYLDSNSFDENGPGTTLSGIPSLASDQSRSWMAVWGVLDLQNPSAGNIQLVVSDSIGKKWSVPRDILETSSLVTPSVATNRQGTWIICWRDNAGIYLIQSTDLGNSWSTPLQLNQSNGAFLSEPMIASDDLATWRILWSETLEGVSRVLSISSVDNGNSWGSLEEVATYSKSLDQVDQISKVSVESDQEGNWLAAFVLNRSTEDYFPLSDQLVISRSEGIVWEQADVIHECQHVRNLDLATDEEEHWLLVWGEEEEDQSPFLRHKIYQALSMDEAYSWQVSSAPIAMGKYPQIESYTKGNWAIVYASQSFIPSSGLDYDIVIAHTDDNGSTWQEGYLVNSQGRTDSSPIVEDQFPVLGQNQTGGWVVTWVRSFSGSAGFQSEVAYQLADSSPPFPVEVNSTQGSITSKNSSLTYLWKAFIDEESGVDHYQYAFGDDTDIERFQSFTSLSETDSIVNFLPTQFPAHFTDFFPTGKYVFTVRATNKVGLFRDSSYTVEIRPLKLGEPIPIPNDKNWLDVNWSQTTFSPRNHVLFIESEQILLTSDYSLEEATVQINWVFNDGSTVLADYDVSPEPVRPPVILYHTHQATSQTTTGAPPVDVSRIDDVIIHYNTTVPAPLDPTDDLELKPFWQSLSNGGQKELNARGTTLQEPAFILLEYQDDVQGFIGVEIVELRPPEADVPTGVVDIGSRILPYDTIVPIDEVVFTKTSIFRGEEDPPLLYQHNVEGAQQEGHLWAIRQNEDETRVRIIWRSMGLADILWPFQFREYQSPSWPEDNTKYQLFVRSMDTDTIGPSISIPAELHPEIVYEANIGQATLRPGTEVDFNSTGVGWSLMKLQTGPENLPGLDWVGFEVVRTIDHRDTSFFDLTEQDWDIGKEVLVDYHQGPKPGYIHVPEGDKFPPEIYAETGQVFGVNEDKMEVWWANLSRVQDPEGPQFPDWPEEVRIQWFSKVSRYQHIWGETPDSNKIIIARQNGSNVIRPEIHGTGWSIYYENDPSKLGFNPNDEHARAFPYKEGQAIFALRDDLGSAASSEPYVLMQYREQPTEEKWRFRVFSVQREEGPYFLRNWEHIVYQDSTNTEVDPYEGDAGKLIQAPFPLSLLQYCQETEAISGPYFEDRNERHWARAAGNDGETADISLRYYYPVQEGFYLDPLPEGTNVGSHIPWLDDLSGTPAEVSYTIHWPRDVPTMKIGQTVLEASFGIPQIDGQCSVDVIYEQSIANGAGNSVLLIDPIMGRSAPLERVPDDIKTEVVGVDLVFADLSLALRRRVSYSPSLQTLTFKGEKISPVVGFDYSLINVMSQRELEELQALSQDAGWQTAVNSLFLQANSPIIIADSDTDPYEALALTSGLAEGTGYVTLAMQNGTQCDPLPVSLEIIKVVPDLEPNGLMVITPDCPFDETLTLRHRGDFGGNSDDYLFEWRYVPDENGQFPDTSNVEQDWLSFSPVPPTGIGAIDATIKGPGLLTLSDNWFICRYKTPDGPYSWSGQWSAWTRPQLAEGWIKRVVGEINPFTQRASGGGIEGAEDSFFDFGDRVVNTIVSMISQAGERWTGNIPLNCNNIDDFGLIEIYETVLKRGIDLSIAGIPPVDYPPANSALLLVASRIADMYTLLGNEAFADAADPTIAYGTEDGVYGTEASSIHCFQNQTANLLEEELSLLRGRDNTNAPGVAAHPVYNRLYWNFTNGDGEVAYASNYDIQDQSGFVDGVIDEADAKSFYPQGHGDAWGHYLSATKTYYELLRQPNYTWNARPEGILLGGEPITVDYFDERKFAKAAAAKARTGAEIVNLSYRAAFVEDPEGQWQGYKDENQERAWGVDEWATRASLASYMDWVAGNAIIPPEDTINSGIQKIDRSTVLELREVASRAAEIQAKMDEANLGLNPLGLATNVVPFDISPTEIDQGKTHFEQIYDRAVTAMNNTITVFNHANNATQLLRRQADNLNDFNQAVEDRESDFTNRLIEIFGYPYPDDIGAGKTYPSGYQGPDLYHFNYVDRSDLMLETPPSLIEVPTYFKEIQVDSDGALSESTREVIFHLPNPQSPNGGGPFGELKPSSWTGQRRAPGELQISRSDLIQAKGRLDRALLEYDNLLGNIEGQWELLQAQFAVNEEEVQVLNAQLNQQESLLASITRSRTRQLNFRTKGRMATLVANAVAEFLPTSVGFSVDATSAVRGGIRLAGTAISEVMTQSADRESIVEMDHQNTLQINQAQTNIRLTTIRQEQAIQQQVFQLQQLIRQEATFRFELYSMVETIQQSAGRYLAILARGQRLLEDRNRFRRQTAANVQSRRYKDMAFRIFRNDALQKYRAQFDLAARYVYLAAKAYDYETTLLSNDNRAGENFLTDIVRQRLIGTVQGGIPQTGQGLSDPMQRMSQNFQVFKSQLGFNNPQRETNRFSLRNELFRIPAGSQGNQRWRDTLRNYLVEDIYALPEFQRYARPFNNPQFAEPALVIPFSTTINSGLNFFGNDNEGGDSSYDPSLFTTKVRSVGVWFSNYNTLVGNGMSNTPRVYLIPVGIDIQRSPTDNFGDIREFKIIDQIIPAPFNSISNGDLQNRDWIPSVDNLTTSFADLRRFSRFRAFHDSGAFNPNEVQRDSRLIGRSVWNTRWLLIIPAETLHSNRLEGIDRFIDGQLFGGQRNGNGVSDIRLFFETYAFPGF